MARYTFTIRKLQILILVSVASSIFTLTTLLIYPNISSITSDEGPGILDQSSTSRWIKPKEFSLYSQKFNINAVDSCSSRVNLLAIVVSSFVSNFNNRRAIRRTWASQVKLEFRRKVCLFFLTGKTDDKNVQSKLLEETNKFDDMIQADFYDSNYNESLKSLAILEWKARFVPRIKFLMKVEDNVYVNVGGIVEELINRFHDRENVLLGSELRNKKPARSKKHLWYVPYNVFPDVFYPLHVKGQAYILDQKAVGEILPFSRSRLIFFKENVFITGMCRENTEISLIHHDGFKVFHDLTEIGNSHMLTISSIQRLEMYEIYRRMNEN